MVNVLVRHSENLCHGLDSHSQVHSPGIGKLQIFATLASTSVQILKEIPDQLTCLQRNLYAGQEATVRTGHGQQSGSKLGKEYVKVVYCHPAYLTYAECII